MLMTRNCLYGAYGYKVKPSRITRKAKMSVIWYIVTSESVPRVFYIFMFTAPNPCTLLVILQGEKS